MRITEAFQTVPAFLLALAFVSVTGPTAPSIVIAIAIGAWTQPARIARAEMLSLRERDFVAAARVIGMRPVEIAFREVLPNALTPVVSLAAVIVAAAVLIEAALSFLGFGDPNRVTWGSMIAEGRDRAARRALPLHRARHRARGHGARRPPDRPRLHDRHGAGDRSAGSACCERRAAARRVRRLCVAYRDRGRCGRCAVRHRPRPRRRAGGWR